MTSETARLELINPYAKYGLKRRPTYDEIAGLIGENETLTGELPDRNATFFKKHHRVVSSMDLINWIKSKNNIQELHKDR